jgi:hypothetical protein
MESRIFDDKLSKMNLNEFESLPDDDYLESEYRKDISYLINNPKFYVNNERIMYVTKYQMSGVYGLFIGKYPLYNFSQSLKQFVDVFKIKNRFSPLFYNLNVEYYQELYLSLKKRMNYFNSMITNKTYHIYYDDSHGRMTYFIIKNILKKNYDINLFPISYNENSLVWKKLIYPRDCVLIRSKKYYSIFDFMEKKVKDSAFLFSLEPEEDYTKLFDKILEKEPIKVKLMLNFYIEDKDESEYSKILKRSLKIFDFVSDKYFICIKIDDIDKLKDFMSNK